MRKMQKRGLLAAAVTGLAVAVDQLTKLLTVLYLELGERISFIPHILNLTFVKNHGASFGMLADHRWVFMSLSALTIVAIIAFFIFYPQDSALLTVSLSLILAGGIGNMIDRIFRGWVVDFLEFDFVNFAVFNAADTFITAGAVLLGIYVVFFDNKTEKNGTKEDADSLSGGQG